MSRRPPARAFYLPSLLFKSTLSLFPRAFRQRYEPEMVSTFRDCCRFAYAERGAIGVYQLCSASLFDMLRAAVRRHREYGLSARGRRGLRLASLLVLAPGLMGALTPYGAVRGVLVAPSLIGIGVLGLSLAASGPRSNPAPAARGPDVRIRRAYVSLLAAACFSGLLLYGDFALASAGDLQPYGGRTGYVSMAASHLLFFGLGLWLYRRRSTWALLPALAVAGAWIYYRAGDVGRIFSGQIAGDALPVLLSLGSFASAAAVWATGLLAIPALLAEHKHVELEDEVINGRRTG